MLACASVQAQDQVEQQIARFKLYTGSAPARILVENLSPDAAVIGLTRDGILITVRSRLRAPESILLKREPGHIYT